MLGVQQNSLKKYRRALCNARVAYYLTLMEDNKNNPRFLFSIVARVTQSHISFPPCIPVSLGGNDFLNFFNNKFILIRERIHQYLSSTGTDISFKHRNFRGSCIYLECFTSIDLQQLISHISSSRPTTCLLDPIQMKLLKEILPLINYSLLDMINLSLLTGYVPQDFKVAVIKPLLKKATLDS